MGTSIYETEVETLKGEKKDLSEYKGKVMLIVNTASMCGFTPQYAGLEQLHSELGARGLEILGFPCNQFGRQEPRSNENIGSFCQEKYGVSFRMHTKIKVNGRDAHPLFRYLKAEAKGLLGSELIKWNFTKFLVDRNGKVVKRFSPATPPARIKHEIETLLEVRGP
jgi:glutathione peroxidase